MMPAPTLSRALVEQALTYPEFRALVTQLAREHRTSGPDQLPFLIRTTEQNQAHLDAAYAQPLLPELAAQLRALPDKWFWVLLGEAWCGDTAHSLPILAHLAAASEGRIELRVLLRSEHPAVMEAHQTKGKNSIPKLICLNANTMAELGTWGPRPAEAQKLSERLHADKELHVSQLIKQMNAWYDADHGQSLQRELLPLVAAWQTVAVG